jgi:hypothetical protein
MMTEQTFIRFLDLIIYDYERNIKYDQRLTEAFGGDTTVITDNPTLEKMVDIIQKEFDDKELVDWYVWEVLVWKSKDQDYPSINVDGVDIEATPQNIYKILKKDIVVSEETLFPFSSPEDTLMEEKELLREF